MEHFVEACARRAARSYGPRWGVDGAACDQDDYRNIFRMAAWRAQLSPACPEAGADRKKWVKTAVHNQMISCHRDRQHFPQAEPYFDDRAYSGPPSDYIAQRDLLGRIRDRLPGPDWTLLVALAETGNVRETWRALDCPGSLGGFKKRVQRIKRLAQRVALQLQEVNRGR